MVQQKSLLQKMEEAIDLIKLLQEEKDEAIARVNGFEAENREMKALLSLAESKADEMLAVRAKPLTDEPKPRITVSEPKETPAAVSFKSPVREQEKPPVRNITEETSTSPSMEQRISVPRDSAPVESDDAPKKSPEEQAKSWTELRERFRRPLSTS
jgi:hypothetical protein